VSSLSRCCIIVTFAPCSPLEFPCKFEFNSQTFSIKVTEANTDIPPQTFRRCLVFRAGDSNARLLGFAHGTPYYIINGAMSKKDGVNAYDFQASPTLHIRLQRACTHVSAVGCPTRRYPHHSASLPRLPVHRFTHPARYRPLHQPAAAALRRPIHRGPAGPGR